MGGVAQVGPFHYGHYSHCCTRIPIADSVRPSVLVWPVPDQRYLRIHFTLSGPVVAQLYGAQAICCAGHRSNCWSYRYPCFNEPGLPNPLALLWRTRRHLGSSPMATRCRALQSATKWRNLDCWIAGACVATAICNGRPTYAGSEWSFVRKQDDAVVSRQGRSTPSRSYWHCRYSVSTSCKRGVSRGPIHNKWVAVSGIVPKTVHPPQQPEPARW